jgi:hypothetical protein
MEIYWINELNIWQAFSDISVPGAVNNFATLSEDTPCPFGTYTIEEGSIFEAFKVEPCY